MGDQKIRKTEAECRQSDGQNWTERLSVCLSDSIFDVWRKRGFRRILHCLLMAQLHYSQLAPRHGVQTYLRIRTHCTHTHTIQILFHIVLTSIAAHWLLDAQGGCTVSMLKQRHLSVCMYVCVCVRARVREREGAG